MPGLERRWESCRTSGRRRRGTGCRARARCAPISCDRLHGARLAVRVHDRDQDRVGPERAPDVVGIDHAARRPRAGRSPRWPISSSAWQVRSTAWCSICEVMMWPPGRAPATPLTARLSDSVPPGREDDLLRADAEEAGDLLARHRRSRRAPPVRSRGCSRRCRSARRSTAASPPGRRGGRAWRRCDRDRRVA